MVTAEWKRAVFHIREQERLKREAEERRRGHEHLDAILDQSGQILEAQQVDLRRGDASLSRSRSRSLSSTLQRWESASVASDQDSSVQDSDDEDDASERSTSEDDEPASAMLLAESAESTKLSNGLTNGHAHGEIREVISVDIDTSSRGTTPASSVPITFSESNAYKMSPNRTFDHHTTESSRQGLPHTNGATGLRKMIFDDSSTGHSSPIPAPHYDDDEEEPVATDEPPQTPSEAYDTLPPESDHDVKKGKHISFADEPEVAFADELSENTSVDPFKPLHVDTTFDYMIPSKAPNAVDETEKASHDEDAAPLTAPKTPEEDTEGLGELETVAEDEVEEDSAVPLYLRPYAVAPVEWDPDAKITPPLLLRGTLRPYQQAGLEWLASLHSSNLNGILADEMGLGKTIQTIALLAHLACDRGIWGPHLIIVPTSVLLNWEMEFKKFLPGFKVLSYHGNSKRRKELRQGWNNKYHFNVCVTSYTLASRDAHVFKRKPWYYMILDEAHMIKNFKSQRWNTLLMFRSFRRLLLTGTPLQNNLTELWALLQFLMSGTNFANLKEFADWFANPLEKAIEQGNVLDEETQQRVTKLHTVLRPYLLRRLKRDVEKELPSKFEHLVMCPLSKRQRFLYDEFMARAETRNDLSSGVYQKIANILMQLRKVVNHPDLFEVRPIRTSFAMSRSAIADFEIKELLIRRELLRESDEEQVNFDLLGLHFVKQQTESFMKVVDTRRFDGTSCLPLIEELPGEPPPYDTRTIAGYKRYKAYQDHSAMVARWAHIRYVNSLRCNRRAPVYSEETIGVVRRFYRPLLPLSALDIGTRYLETVERTYSAVKSYAERAQDMSAVVDRFAFVTPAVVARDIARLALSGYERPLLERANDLSFDAPLHRISVKLQIAFPDPSLLQYDCGKLQQLDRLLRERKAGGHRILIFTQMTRILDILEIFLNFRGYLYLRLDGATKIEDRQYITERFNTDPRIFCFISSSRSGGVGINLTGADTVVFYDSDFNPQMDKQCEDR
ncbi:hypothetical protein NM688_g8978 [Phlebia brevispora]|uniref:Uncharacterized protein n=1 Tax=Phlebia brevispora TaxID=194682 RepID=A0ACC1RKU0_9APHY|nr:hypothetical protein NM688_g8978 [Phlebia brevispora]